jgi:hypothetical protein
MVDLDDVVQSAIQFGQGIACAAYGLSGEVVVPLAPADLAP